jgi:GNAT superfamily N-acetyltransferase
MPVMARGYVPLARPRLSLSRVVLIRRANANDGELIAAMLVAAADWRPGVERRSVDAVMTDPALAHYAEGWPRETDLGVIAEDEDGTGVGAAWWRFFKVADPGFGFVDESVPEVSIGVALGKRGAGVGRALLDALVQCAVDEGVKGLSLSVETDNFAMRMYERAGFKRRAQAGGSVTMLLTLDRV